MRPEVRQRFEIVAEEFLDDLLERADPKTWPGAGIELRRLSGARLRARVQAKKELALDLRIAIQLQQLLGGPIGSGEELPNDPRSLDEQIADAERRAQEILQRVKSKGH